MGPIMDNSRDIVASVGDYRRRGPRFNGDLMDVFEVSHDLVCVCRDGVISAMNTAGQRLLKAKDSSSLCGRRMSEFLIPEYVHVLEAFLSGREIEDGPVPIRIRALDHSVRDVELQVFPARELGLLATVVIGRDVTREGRLAEHARDSLARFTALVDNAMNLVCHVVDGTVRYINRAGRAQLRADNADSLLGRPLAEFFQDDYADLVAPENLELLLAEMGPVAMRLKRLDGSCFDAQVMISRLESKQGKELMVETNDITSHHNTVMALRQSTETLLRKSREMQELQTALAAREIGVVRRRLSEAQRVARIGTMERDDHGNWQLCPHACSLLDVSGPEPSPVGVVTNRLLEPERSDVIVALDAFPGTAVDIEFSVPNGDGTRIVHAVGSALSGADDDVFITLQDVTIRHAIDKERAQMRARAEEASRLEALGTLAGGIAHEINTPVQFIGDNLHFIETGASTLLEVVQVAREVVMGAAGLDSLASRMAGARLDFLAREIPAAAQEALGGVGRIATIVQAVKEACYPSAKVPEAFDLNHMIQSVVTLTRTTWKYVAEMKLDLDDCLPPLTAIEGEISQVAMNLVINAAHAIGEKGQNEPGLIEVCTRRCRSR